MEVRTSRSENCHFIWDAARLPEAREHHFEPDWWQAGGMVVGAAAGRGAAYFLDTPHGAWVLRHYRRGGLVSKLIDDRYRWLGVRRSRAFLEWRLLAQLAYLGLPVPAPVAARVARIGSAYRADLITVRVPNTDTVHDVLLAGAMETTAWRTLGHTLAWFHAAGVWHADLNAKNILVDGDRRFTLIDFDHSRLRKPGRWAKRNLARLRRSLDKQQAQHGEYHFAEADWNALLSGYLTANSPLAEKPGID